MPPLRIACPECLSLLQPGSDLALDTPVKCPRCGFVFTLATAADPNAVRSPSPPPPAERPVSRYEVREVEPATGEGDPFEAYDDPPRLNARRRLVSLPEAYTIDVGAWFRIGMAHYTAVLGPMIGYTVIYGLIRVILLQGIPCLGPIVDLVINPPLLAGFTIVSQAQLKGQRWDFGDFFRGFQRVGDFFLFALLAGVLTVLAALPAVIAGFIAVAAADRQDDAGATIAVVAAVVLGLVALYISFRMTCMAVPILVDHHCGPGEALTASWQLSGQNFFFLFGIFVLLTLINLGGLLLFCAGLLFTLPLTFLVWNAGYLLIAGTQQPLEQPRAREEQDLED